MARLTSYDNENDFILVNEEERLLTAKGFIDKDEMYKMMRHLAEKLFECENTIDKGYVTESNVAHNRITYMRPTKRDYSDKDHPNYYKYTCPICDMLGNKHQVHKGETNCCLCGVNLLWEEEQHE